MIFCGVQFLVCPWYEWLQLFFTPVTEKKQQKIGCGFHYFYVHRSASLGKWSNLTLTNQMPWNHQPENIPAKKWGLFQRHPDLVEILASRGTSLLPTLFNGILVCLFVLTVIFSDLSSSHKNLKNDKTRAKQIFSSQWMFYEDLTIINIEGGSLPVISSYNPI